MKQKKLYALIRVRESINRSKEKLSNGSSDIIILKHKTREKTNDSKHGQKSRLNLRQILKDLKKIKRS